MKLAHLASAAILSLVTSTFAASLECIDSNDSSFLNKCLMVENKMFLHVVYDFVNSWINPNLFAKMVLIFILILPLFMLENLDSTYVLDMLRRYGRTKLSLLNYLHRICFVICLNVTFFAIIKQKRPCTCTTDGGATWSVYGSLYGMPSMDTFNASILAATLFELAPMHVWTSRILAIFVIPGIALNGVLLGADSIAQALVGAFLGILFHVYSTRMPQFMIGFDTLLSFCFGMTFILFDPNLIYTYDSPVNLFSWWLSGFSFQLFATILIFRHHTYKSYLPLGFSLTWMIAHDFMYSKDDQEHDFCVIRKPDFVGKGRTTPFDMFMMSDYAWTLSALVVFLIFNFLASGVQHYGWLTRIKA